MFRLTSDNVLIRMDKPIDEAESGLLIYEEKKHMSERPWFATVLDCGPGFQAEVGKCKYVKTTLKPGDRLIVQDSQVGQPVTAKQFSIAEDGDYRLVRECGTDVVAVVSE